jgi:sensor histidine kinase regulating citrate/malate metabolism
MQTKRVIMNTFDPFEYLLGFAMIGTTISLIPDMSETLRFVLLLFTVVGASVKLWEQIKKSEHFKNDMLSLWKKIKGEKSRD